MSVNVIELSDSAFKQQVIENDHIVLVDFWATWCGPCRALAPILENIAQALQGKVVIGKMDVDQHPKTPGEYDVQAIPTLLIFKNGNVVERLIGLQQQKIIEAAIQKHL